MNYQTRIKYYHSSLFNLDIKQEEEDNVKFILTYINEIHYTLSLDFNDIKKKFEQINNFQEFFNFLNDSRNGIMFYISILEEQFCSLIMKFPNDDLSKIFVLKNENPSFTIESFNLNKLLDYTVDELIEACNYETTQIIEDIPFENREYCYRFNLNFSINNHSYIIFFEEINVEIKIGEKIINQNVRSNQDILKILDKENINIMNVFFKNQKLSEIIYYIDCFIENNKLSLKVIEQYIPKIKFGQPTLFLNQDNYLSDYSKYFLEYFENLNEEDGDESFIFERTDLRKEIYKNILKMKDEKTIQKYKITGPFSSGKSFTLFIYSRILENTIYINLKIIKKNKENYKKCLNIIFSECNRVSLNKYIFKEKIKLLNIGDNI